MKDDSGSYAVFMEQGSLLQDYQAAQVKQLMQYQLTYTQVKMENASNLLKLPKIRMSRHLDMSPTTQVAQILVEHRRSCVFFAERNMYGHTLAGLLCERQFC